MLLKDLNADNSRKMEKINKLLREHFGFTLASNIETGKLDKLYTKIADDLYNLKLDLSNVRSKDYAQKLLVAEGLKMMLDDRKAKIATLREAHLVGPGARRYEAALNAAAMDVEHACEIGDDYEEAIRDAMKDYRSSELRFPDQMFEFDLREMTKHCTLDSQIAQYEGEPMAMECGMYESEELDEAGIKLRKFVPGLGKAQAASRAQKHRDAARLGSQLVYAAGEERRDTKPGDDFWSDNSQANRDLKTAKRYDRIRQGDPPFGRIHEEAPPGMEDWIKDRKAEFKKQYGDRWQEVLYATAWKEHNKKNESLQEDAGHSILDIITPEELEELQGYVNGKLNPHDFLGSNVYEKLFSYYLESGEMPYGVAKVRTGEPDVWILDRVCQDYGDEVCVMDEGSDAARGRAAEREWVADLADRARERGDVEVSRSRSGEDYFTFMGRKQSQPAKAAPAKKRRFAFGFGEGVNESNNKQNGETKMKEGYVKQLRKLLEAEVEQAESLIAARGFSQELQDMVEKLGRLVNEDLPAVAEQMRDAYGADIATGFENTVGETLSSVMDSLKSSKQDIDNSVAAIADGQAPSAGVGMSDEDFGDEEGAELDLDLDGEEGAELDLDMGDGEDMDLELGDEEGEGELLGRAKKESVERRLALKKQIVEMKQKLAKIKAKRSK